MEVSVLKIILISSVLIAVYYLFLEREKILKFNRFFLLFSLVFAYVLPFITIKIPNFEKNKPQLIFEETVQNVLIVPTKVEEQSFNWENFIIEVYALVTLFLLVKSMISIFKIFRLKGNTILVNSQKIKVLDKNISPFSFFNTIYVGNNYLKNGEIDERIFLHEKNHIEQKHSLDLIFVEVLKIFSWFNPAIYFYKKAIITNHEFLADEKVLTKNFEVKQYQSLILDEISDRQNLHFTHQFNFNNTKKRFIMMTTQKSKISGVKKLLSIPIFAILFVFFVQKVYAENSVKQTVNISSTEEKHELNQKPETTTDNVSENPYEEFQKILGKYADLI